MGIFYELTDTVCVLETQPSICIVLFFLPQMRKHRLDSKLTQLTPTWPYYRNKVWKYWHRVDSKQKLCTQRTTNQLTDTMDCIEQKDQSGVERSTQCLFLWQNQNWVLLKLILTSGGVFLERRKISSKFITNWIKFLWY